MRRIRLLCVCVLVGVLLTVTTAFGGEKAVKLYNNMMSAADKIVAHNKPTAGPKYEETDPWGGKGWVKTWKKNGTHVTGTASKKKGKYRANFIETTDPNMAFIGGVRVGADVKVLENYIGLPLRQLDPKNTGTIELFEDDMREIDAGPYVEVKHQGGKITLIKAFYVFP